VIFGDLLTQLFVISLSLCYYLCCTNSLWGLYLQVVKDHGPFIDFELLRDKHAHCSVFLSFLVSNADPAPLVSFIYACSNL